MQKIKINKKILMFQIQDRDLFTTLAGRANFYRDIIDFGSSFINKTKIASKTNVF